jgi:hypothetical protein
MTKIISRRGRPTAPVEQEVSFVDFELDLGTDDADEPEQLELPFEFVHDWGETGLKDAPQPPTTFFSGHKA